MSDEVRPLGPTSRGTAPTWLIAAGLAAMLAGQSAVIAEEVMIGWQELEITGDAGEPPLDVALWYPTRDPGATVVIGDTPVFVGVAAVPEARPSGAGLPLVVLSHGFGGHRGNLAWLAAALAETGHVVAALDHPGTTTRDMRPGEPAVLARRSAEVGRVIDRLTADRPEPIDAGPIDAGLIDTGLIDAGRIAVIGHSLGAWTALQLAGARFSLDRALADCDERPGLAACELLAWAGTDDPQAAAILDGDRRDVRVAAAVALDIGMARGFTEASLEAVDIPVLVAAAGAPNPGIPAALESGHLSTHLPATTTGSVELAAAGHFSFMPRCKPGAVELLAAEAPGDEIVCLDGGAADRAALHDAVVEATLDFLADAWPGQRP